MFGTIATIFLFSVGALLALVILAYAFYITLFPLFRTIGGGLQVLKKYGGQRVRATERDYDLLRDTQLGVTMADGGHRIEEEEDSGSEQ